MRREGSWHIPALIAVAALLCVTMLIIGLQDRRDKIRMAQVRTEAAALERERDALVAQRDRAERDYADAARTAATEQLLFLELDEQLYTEVYPLLQEQEICGVLGLSEGKLPGDPGLISREQFDELIEAGWGLCLICDTRGDFAQWDQEMGARLLELGIPKPAAIYFPEERYRSELREQLSACGYTCVVQHGEAGDPAIAGDADGELWIMGAHPWNYDGVRGEITLLVQKGGNHCFAVSFTDGKREAYQRAAFENMLNYIGAFREKDQLLVTDFEAARALHDPELNGAAELAARWEREREELDARIQELDRQIRQIYAKWNGEKHD